MMVSAWKPLFGLNLAGHLSTYPSVGRFALWKPQKVPKRCPRTFPVQQKYKLQYNHKKTSQRNLRFIQVLDLVRLIEK